MRPWLLLEQSASAVSWRDVNVPKAPGQMRIDSMQAIAHGSDGAMFFQWRQAKFGQEKFHSAMLGHRGEESRSFKETKALGAELKKLEPVRGTRVRASVGLVVDWDSWWGSSATESLPSQRLNYAAQARAWNAAFFRLGHPVDTVRATDSFEGYDVVVVPNLYIASNEQAAALTAFVERGGQLVVGPFSGVVDETEKVHAGGAPGPLRELLGIEVDEHWPIPDGIHEKLEVAGESFAVSIWSEWLELITGTEVLGSHTSGELAGRAAVTRRAGSGTGAAWYLGVVPEAAGLDALFRRVLEAAGLPAREVPDTVLESVTRSDEDTDYTFVLNHGTEPLAVTDPAGFG